MTRICQFLGVKPSTVSVGGTRTRDSGKVCLLATGTIEQVNGVSAVTVGQLKPKLVLGRPLNEIEISSSHGVLWSQLATSKGPIQGRIAWPIEPIKPNQRLELAMRPRGAAGGDWAFVTLIGAESGVISKMLGIINKISQGPFNSPLSAIDTAVSRGEDNIAIALAWMPDFDSRDSGQIRHFVRDY